MNTIETRQAALVAFVLVVGAGCIAGNLHREVLAFAWPYLTSFYDTYIQLQIVEN